VLPNSSTLDGCKSSSEAETEEDEEEEEEEDGGGIRNDDTFDDDDEDENEDEDEDGEAEEWSLAADDWKSGCENALPWAVLRWTNEEMVDWVWIRLLTDGAWGEEEGCNGSAATEGDTAADAAEGEDEDDATEDNAEGTIDVGGGRKGADDETANGEPRSAGVEEDALARGGDDGTAAILAAGDETSGAADGGLGFWQPWHVEREL
jgi:hypothetical protein